MMGKNDSSFQEFPKSSSSAINNKISPCTRAARKRLRGLGKTDGGIATSEIHQPYQKQLLPGADRNNHRPHSRLYIRP